MVTDPAQGDVASLRALLEAATPGPWECYIDGLVWPSDKGPAANDPIAAVSEAHEECGPFIAAARNALPALLDRLVAAEAKVADAWDEGHRLTAPHSDRCEPRCPNPYRAALEQTP